MDHAGDATYKLQRAFKLHSWNEGCSLSEPVGDRQKQSFILYTADAQVFRVTVDDIGFEGLTEDESYRDKFVG